MLIEGENQIGRVSTQAAANNNLVFTNVSSLKWVAELERHISHGGLYQQIALELIVGFKAKRDLIEMATSLVALAEHSYAHRRMEIVEQVSRILMCLPAPRFFRQVGQFYLAMHIKRQSRFDEAQSQFEALADDLPDHFKSRAIMSLAAIAFDRADYRSALPLYIEASRAEESKGLNDPSVKIVAQRMVAVVKSLEGDHHGALASLDCMFPLVRAVGRWKPYLFYEHLNSLAVELAGVGELEGARRAAEIALRSSYAHAYPEWRETRDEIAIKSRRASRSFVVGVRLPVVPNNVTHMSFAGYAGNSNLPRTHSAPSQMGRVIRFEEWIKMSKESQTSQDKLAHPQIQQMTLSEKQAALLRLIYADNVSEEMLDKLLKAAEEGALIKQVSS